MVRKDQERVIFLSNVKFLVFSVCLGAILSFLLPGFLH
jgi:hypothetical protein